MYTIIEIVCVNCTYMYYISAVYKWTYISVEVSWLNNISGNVSIHYRYTYTHNTMILV